MGSKGLPFKNRKLFKKTADTIPKEWNNRVWVTTDDPEIIQLSQEYKFSVIDRPGELANDTANIRDVMMHTVQSIKAVPNTIFTMLYLTYPQRTWNDILVAHAYFDQAQRWGEADSLLCKKEVKVSPYLMMHECGWFGAFGRQVIQHDLYRRQDYPKCFEISHYISIFRAGSLPKLNNNMYGANTVFYQIGDTVDVDTQKDLDNIQ
jgi:CMP-N-acetylneuraminic acid synthetase